MVAVEPDFWRGRGNRRAAEPAPDLIAQKSDLAGTKPAPRDCLFNCSNLERGESMKDPVSIFGCWRGFQFAGCLAALANKRWGGSIADFCPAGSTPKP